MLNRDVDLASSPQKLWFHDMRALEKQKKEAWVDCLLMGLLVGLTNKPHQTGPQMSSSSKANPTYRSLLMLCGREGRPDECNPSPVGS